MIQLVRKQQKLQFCLVTLVITLMYCCGITSAASTSASAHELPPAPEFALHDMQGDGHKFSSYSGKTVIVNFWAVWCSPCRREIPAMNRAWQKLKDENVAMLAINVGDERAAIEAFNKDYPIDFTVLRDKNGEVSQQWQVNVFPTTFVINPQGQIVHRVTGGREWDDENMLESIRAVTVN